MRKLPRLALAALFPLFLWAAHNRLTLRDGRVINGMFVSGDSRAITFQDENGVRRRYNVGDVQSVDFTDSEGSSSTSSALTDADRRAEDLRATRAARAGRRAGVETRTVPAGTEIEVRTNDAINSETATEGRTYSAVVQKDVVDSSGNVVIPRGSDAQLVIRNVSSGGVTGSANLALDLDSVTIRGRRYVVSTTDLEQSSRSGIGKNKRTAEMVGGGAALGTLLGAIAGGGKGAVIGAIAGAAAGGTAEVLTKGKQVKVPAETVLTFRLDQPLRLQEAG